MIWRHLKRMRRGASSKLALLSTRGLDLLPGSAPLATRRYAHGRPRRTLIVFLPGIFDVAEDFAARGFVRAVAESGLPADAVAVDAHYGYYARRSIVHRLALDVVLPAQRTGYREIWLVGISMGGLAALSYTMHHPDQIARLVLLAPYLGEEAAWREIGSGRMPASQADPHTLQVWEWINRYRREKRSTPRIYLGYGTHDRFADANRLLAAHLPPQNVITLDGGHNWRTWKKLWDEFMLLWQGVPASASAPDVRRSLALAR